VWRELGKRGDKRIDRKLGIRNHLLYIDLQRYDKLRQVRGDDNWIGSNASGHISPQTAFNLRRHELWIILLGQGHGLVIQFVTEYDRSIGCVGRSSVDDVLIVLLDGRNSKSRVIVIERILNPNDCSQSESVGDVTDSVVNVTIRWSPTFWRDTNDVLSIAKYQSRLKGRYRQ
jgi:hypothetical protein